MPFDPETFRAESRQSWDAAAAGWTSEREAMQRDALPVSQWIVQAAALEPGDTVLEVAAGLGDTGLLAAERVGAEGRVIITDGSEEMVAAALAHARESGAENVDNRQMEAEWLDQPTASVDAVLSRWGYMLLADPEAALREARRVQKPGGRLSIAVWDALDRNPWIGVIQRELGARELVPPPEPGSPGMFALADHDHVTSVVEDAGFGEVRVEPIEFAFHARDADAWWEQNRTISISLKRALDGLAPADHYALRDAIDVGYGPFTAEDGSLTLPAVALGVSAEA